jgi:predicted permease
VLAEVALATVLVFGAGLTVKSFANLVHTDPGFEAAGRMSAGFYLPPASYEEPERVLSYERRLLERARALPGVEDAALASSLPLEGDQWTADFTVEGRRGEPGIDIARRIVSPGYFRTMGVPVLRGRELEASDSESSRPVIVINEALARHLFGDHDPLGQRIARGREPGESAVWREVVGVVGNEKIESLAADGRMEVFLPVGQEMLGEPGRPQRSYKLVVRSAGHAPPSAEALRAAAAALDPRVPLFDVTSLSDLVAETASRERLLMGLMALFAVLALMLASVGIYGLMVYSVGRRQREIGVRLALGARPVTVVRMVLVRGMGLFGGGVAAGLATALLLAGGLEAVLFRVDPWDAQTLAAAVAVLGGAALAATLLPARRAARVDPLETLRVD